MHYRTSSQSSSSTQPLPALISSSMSNTPISHRDLRTPNSHEYINPQPGSAYSLGLLGLHSASRPQTSSSNHSPRHHPHLPPHMAAMLARAQATQAQSIKARKRAATVSGNGIADEKEFPSASVHLTTVYEPEEPVKSTSAIAGPSSIANGDRYPRYTLSPSPEGSHGVSQDRPLRSTAPDRPPHETSDIPSYADFMSGAERLWTVLSCSQRLLDELEAGEARQRIEPSSRGSGELRGGTSQMSNRRRSATVSDAVQPPIEID